METLPQTPLDNRQRNQLVRYGLAAAAAVAAATPATSQATMIVTNAGDITGDTIFFDLQGGVVSNTAGTAGVTDFRLYINTAYAGPKPAIAAYTGTVNTVLATLDPGPASPYAPRLNAGDTIGAPGQTFFSDARFDESSGEWSTGSRGFLGLSLNIGGNQFFGWADLTLNNFGGMMDNAFTLHGFAFNDVAGEAVTAGGGPAAVPENGSTAMLLLLGAAGVVALRKRCARQEAA